MFIKNKLISFKVCTSADEFCHCVHGAYIIINDNYQLQQKHQICVLSCVKARTNMHKGTKTWNQNAMKLQLSCVCVSVCVCESSQ